MQSGEPTEKSGIKVRSHRSSGSSRPPSAATPPRILPQSVQNLQEREKRPSPSPTRISTATTTPPAVTNLTDLTSGTDLISSLLSQHEHQRKSAGGTANGNKADFKPPPPDVTSTGQQVNLRRQVAVQNHQNQLHQKSQSSEGLQSVVSSTSPSVTPGKLQTASSLGGDLDGQVYENTQSQLQGEYRNIG